ncbi:hypothetical protein OC861_003625 [Tilletia horrida]|nr:hypothetical protein OC845_003660 [Tilletia horrida]KAK0565678.1 hypothetical protein OC861_003625 [Tilletia horrida]
MNFESPSALRRRIEAVQFADDTGDELSLGMARRAPSGVDSSMLSFMDSTRDVSSISKSINRNDYSRSPSARPPTPPRLPSPFQAPAEKRAVRPVPTQTQRPASTSCSTARRPLTPTLAPTQDQQASSPQDSTSGHEAQQDHSNTAGSTNATVPPKESRAPLATSGNSAEPGATAFSVAARRIRLANGTPVAASKSAAGQVQGSPQDELSTPRASNINSAINDSFDTPAAAGVSYAPSAVSTTSSNDLLSPAVHRMGRGNTSLPGFVGPESVLRPRPGGTNIPTTSRIASGNAAGAHVDVGKLAAYQHKINSRLEDENARLRNDAEQLTTRVEELEDEMERKEADLDRALATNKELRGRLDELERASQRRDAQVEKLERERAQFEARSRDAERGCKQLREECEEFRDEGSKMLAELEDLNVELDQKNKDLVEALADAEKLQRRVVQLEQQQVGEKEQQSTTPKSAPPVEANRRETAALQRQIDEQIHQMRRKERELEQLQKTNQKLQAQVEDVRGEARISRLDDVEAKQIREENEYLISENKRLIEEAQDLADQLEELRSAPPRHERSQTVRFDDSVAPDDQTHPRPRSALRAVSAKGTPNKTFDLSLPNLANLSSMSWLNDTTIGDQGGMVAIIQQLQREVDERNVHVDELLTKLDSYGKLLLQLGEKYELAQRKLASLAVVERDHDRMVIERDEILDDVDRLERDMRQVRTEAVQIGRELEALRSVKEARRYEESALDLHMELIGKIRQHHIEECKGLMLRIRYLKAKWVRENDFRADLSYQKTFLQQLVGGLERDLKATQVFVADVSASRGFSQRQRTPRNRLKEAMVAVRAVVRMKLMSEKWRQASASKVVLNEALIDARARREQRRLVEGNATAAPAAPSMRVLPPSKPAGRVSV